MALKDLVADRGKLNEETIERIISKFIRYDPATQEIIFTPDGVKLANEAKVLMYLVAVSGWRYVLDDPAPVNTKPSDLENALGIPGGSLRPILMKLKDGHLLAVNQGHYSIQLANLNAVDRVLAGEKAVSAPRRAASSKKPKAVLDSTEPDENDLEPEVSDGGAKERRKAKSGVPIRSSLAKLVSDGWFSQERTLSQVVTRLHEKAIIAKLTSLSGPIAELVRNGTLERKKLIENGKEVWSYKAA